MKTIILALFILLSLISCDKEKSENICSGTTFIFLNEKGQDIFNQNSTNYVDTSEFEIQFSNGKNINFTLFNLNDTNVFEIGINGLSEEGITYFKFGDLTIDTLFAKYIEDGNCTYLNELYYNDSLIEKNASCGECGNNTHVHTITIKAE